ncbi:MAG: hypothetical protein J1E00_07450 [Oscillospiraceae bacterium]|nr:hypothetical protein [Oscillospiraceae bacterium]
MRRGLLLLAVAVILLSGCGEGTRNEGTGSAVNGGSEDGVKRAFLAQYVQDPAYGDADLSVREVGTFDGFRAVYVDGVLDYTQAYDEETVGGRTFLYVSGQHLLIYSEETGELYSLQEALEAKVLDGDGLREVYEAHRRAEPLRYEEGGEVPDREILRAYVERFRPDCSVEALSLVRLGVFDGCHAVFVNGPFLWADVITTQKVGGLSFVYPTSQVMYLYRDGGLYTLPEAWEEGLIGREALRDLHDAFPNRDPAKVK